MPNLDLDLGKFCGSCDGGSYVKAALALKFKSASHGAMAEGAEQVLNVAAPQPAGPGI